MSITPSGAPAWSRTADHTVYGGNANKVNYQSQGVTNALTDVGAEGFCRMAADAAGVTRTGAFAELTITCRDTPSALAPMVEAVHQMTGVQLASYPGDAPPTGFPTVTRNGTGDVTVTWATSYTDPYGVSQAVNIKHALCSAQSDVLAIACNPNISAANVVRVRCRTFPGGVDAANARFTLEVS